MNWYRRIILLIWAVGNGACNWVVPTSDEGIVKDSIIVTDSFAAKSDTLALIDSSYTKKDSFASDQTRNNDTSILAPSLGIDVKGRNPDEVMKFAETLKGVPYVYGSINPNVGFDCSGFITYVFNHFGITVPRSSIDFTNVGKPIPVEQSKRGDIILFTGTNPAERFVGHMGLIVSNGPDSLRFIHSTSGKAMGVTTTALGKYYQSRFVKTIRIFPQNDQ